MSASKKILHCQPILVTILISLSVAFPLSSWAFDASRKPAETQSVPGNMLLALSVEFLADMMAKGLYMMCDS